MSIRLFYVLKLHLIEKNDKCFFIIKYINISLDLLSIYNCLDKFFNVILILNLFIF